MRTKAKEPIVNDIIKQKERLDWSFSNLRVYVRRQGLNCYLYANSETQLKALYEKILQEE